MLKKFPETWAPFDSGQKSLQVRMEHTSEWDTFLELAVSFKMYTWHFVQVTISVLVYMSASGDNIHVQKPYDRHQYFQECPSDSYIRGFSNFWSSENSFCLLRSHHFVCCGTFMHSRTLQGHVLGCKGLWTGPQRPHHSSVLEHIQLSPLGAHYRRRYIVVDELPFREACPPPDLFFEGPLMKFCGASGFSKTLLKNDDSKLILFLTHKHSLDMITHQWIFYWSGHCIRGPLWPKGGCRIGTFLDFASLLIQPNFTILFFPCVPQTGGPSSSAQPFFLLLHTQVFLLKCTHCSTLFLNQYISMVRYMARYML